MLKKILSYISLYNFQTIIFYFWIIKYIKYIYSPILLDIKIIKNSIFLSILSTCYFVNLFFLFYTYYIFEFNYLMLIKYLQYISNDLLKLVIILYILFISIVIQSRYRNPENDNFKRLKYFKFIKLQFTLFFAMKILYIVRNMYKNWLRTCIIRNNLYSSSFFTKFIVNFLVVISAIKDCLFLSIIIHI